CISYLSPSVLCPPEAQRGIRAFYDYGFLAFNSERQSRSQQIPLLGVPGPGVLSDQLRAWVEVHDALADRHDLSQESQRQIWQLGSIQTRELDNEIVRPPGVQRLL